MGVGIMRCEQEEKCPESSQKPKNSKRNMTMVIIVSIGIKYLDILYLIKQNQQEFSHLYRW